VAVMDEEPYTIHTSKAWTVKQVSVSTKG
jgi:hypothetical protein